ncbi:hypothetical protein UVI_02059300 [Ustilaginoidea virens]|uniref:Uncharacterized protein n=1 Tax=Ustilaginoidea virens TaxID=1159556 RepID=A0A1B5L5W5_USTVR|nr:hypothetical protein UVI_02059300 [Ustilaginoidea virens]
MYSPDLHNIHTLGHLAGFIYPFTQSSNIIQRLSMPFPNSFDVTMHHAVVGVMGVLSLLILVVNKHTVPRTAGLAGLSITGLSLTTLSLTGLKLPGRILMGRILMGRILMGRIPTGLVLTGLILMGRIPTGLILTGLILAGLILTGRIPTGLILTGLILAGLILTGLILTGLGLTALGLTALILTALVSKALGLMAPAPKALGLTALHRTWILGNNELPKLFQETWGSGASFSEQRKRAILADGCCIRSTMALDQLGQSSNSTNDMLAASETSQKTML